MRPTYALFINVTAVDGQIPLMSLDLQTVFGALLVLFNVTVLAFVLTKLLYKPVTQFLRKRTDHIWEQLRFAEAEKADAEALKAELDQRLSSIAAERADILETARKTADENARQRLEEAKQEAENIKGRALREIKMEQDRAESEIKQSVLALSTAMAAKFLAASMDEAAHDRLFDETLRELEGVSWQS